MYWALSQSRVVLALFGVLREATHLFALTGQLRDTLCNKTTPLYIRTPPNTNCGIQGCSLHALDNASEPLASGGLSLAFGVFRALHAQDGLPMHLQRDNERHFAHQTRQGYGKTTRAAGC